MAQEQPGQTLQATALVHEAYIRLVDSDQKHNWDNRSHFFAAAAEAMRRILVERARKKTRKRRGGDRKRCDLAEHDLTSTPINDELLDLDEALSKFSNIEPEAAQARLWNPDSSSSSPGD